METIAIAFIVAMASMLGPLLLARYTNAQRRIEKLEDYARQDFINQTVAASNRSMNMKLEGIHTLVNSNLSASKQAELNALEAQLAMMREVVAFRNGAGDQPIEQTTNAITALSRRIEELKAELADRNKQTQIANEQLGKA